MRGRVYLQTVARMRAGKPGDWTTERTDHDRAVVRRLLSRVGYGGRKGHRAFLRLWRMGIRPPATRITVTIKGFELTGQSSFGSWIIPSIAKAASRQAADMGASASQNPNRATTA